MLLFAGSEFAHIGVVTSFDRFDEARVYIRMCGNLIYHVALAAYGPTTLIVGPNNSKISVSPVVVLVPELAIPAD